jgi:hypothetical protein
MFVSGHAGTKCCGKMLQVVMHSHGYNHCWRESAPRPSTHRGDPYEDGCSDVSRTIAVRGLSKRHGPGTPDATAARCTATATQCSAASRSTASRSTAAACAEHCAGSTEHRARTAERAAVTVASRNAATSAVAHSSAAAAHIFSAACVVSSAKSATAFISAVAEIPISLVAAVSAAAAVPILDTSDTPGDDPSAATTVRPTAMGTL